MDKQTDSKNVAFATPASTRSLGAKAVASYWKQRRAKPLDNAFRRFTGTYDPADPLTEFEGRLFGEILLRTRTDPQHQRMTDRYLYARLQAWADQGHMAEQRREWAARV